MSANNYTIPTDNVQPVVIPNATETDAGVMSAADKLKLDGLIPGGAAGLNGVYDLAASAADNIIGLTAALGPVLIRDNATPTGTTLFGVQTNTGTVYVGITAAALTVNIAASFTGTVAVPTPTLSGQAANKAYVDAQIAADNSLREVYLNAAAATDNIIGLTAALGPVLIRDNATPTGTTLFGVQTNAAVTLVEISAAALTTRVSILGGASTGQTLTLKSNAVDANLVSISGTTTTIGSASTDLLVVTSAISTNLLFVKEVNHTISVANSTTSNVAGGSLAITAGSATAGTAVGGNISITTGGAFGTNQAAGTLTLDTGAPTGSGAAAASLVATNAKTIAFGSSTSATTFAGNTLFQKTVDIQQTTVALFLSGGVTNRICLYGGPSAASIAQTGAGYLAFHSNSDGSTTSPTNERMRLTNSGNFLIGSVTDNGHKLAVGNVTNSDTANVFAVKGQVFIEGQMQVGGTANISAFPTATFVIHTGTNQNLWFYGGGGTLRMTTDKDDDSGAVPLQLDAGDTNGLMLNTLTNAAISTGTGLFTVGGKLKVIDTITVNGYIINPGATVPSSGNVLAYNGSAFVPTTGGGSGTVTSVATGTGLTGGTITTTGTLSIDQSASLTWTGTERFNNIVQAQAGVGRATSGALPIGADANTTSAVFGSVATCVTTAINGQTVTITGSTAANITSSGQVALGAPTVYLNQTIVSSSSDIFFPSANDTVTHIITIAPLVGGGVQTDKMVLAGGAVTGSGGGSQGGDVFIRGGSSDFSSVEWGNVYIGDVARQVIIGNTDAGAVCSVSLVATGGITIFGGTSVTVGDTGDAVGFFGSAGAMHAGTIADAAGGVVVDSQARTAINSLLAVVRGYNLITT